MNYFKNILKKVVKKFGSNKERVVSLTQAITLITLKIKIMKKLLVVLGLAMVSCSMEDVCGTVNGFDVDCQTAGGTDCVYYIYLDGQKVSVSRDIWNTTQYGEEVCIGY